MRSLPPRWESLLISFDDHVLRGSRLSGDNFEWPCDRDFPVDSMVFTLVTHKSEPDKPADFKSEYNYGIEKDIVR